MIYTRDLVLEKIDELKAYCKENSPYKNMYGNIGGSFDWDSFFAQLYAASSARIKISELRDGL